MNTQQVIGPARLSPLNLALQWRPYARARYQGVEAAGQFQPPDVVAIKAAIGIMELGADHLEDITPHLLREWARTAFKPGENDEREWAAHCFEELLEFAVERGCLRSNPFKECGPLATTSPGSRPPAWVARPSA